MWPMTPEQLDPAHRRAVSTGIDIDAPAERVWEVMVDAGGYGNWNPFIVSVDAPRGFGIGECLTLWVRMPGSRGLTRSREQVSRCEPPEGGQPGHLVYRYSDIPSRFGLVRATRWQGVEPLAADRARYQTIEAFGGWLWRLLPYGRIETGFAAHAKALKHYCERR